MARSRLSGATRWRLSGTRSRLSGARWRLAAAATGLALLAAPTPPVAAQEAAVVDLFERVWSDGVESAVEAWRGRPSTERDPRLLLSLADQLLWTGRADDAETVLDLAEARAPSMARIQFEQGRMHLQRGELDEAEIRFLRGAEIVDADTSLAEADRETLARRLHNRIGLLEAREALLARSGAYRTADGELLLFKFDPYIHTFPALLDAESGNTRILYPVDGELEWRDEDGEPIGRVRFDDAPDGAGRVSIEAEGRTLRATSIGITAEPVRYEASGAEIAATLFRPPGEAAVPAVVLTHGAGLSTRYNLVHEALSFAAAGVAALVYDKPGLGESRGANWLLLSIEDQAEYVLGGARALNARPDIGVVGVWGFSQGGWVAPLAATRWPEIAFVIMASGAAVGPQAQATQSLRLELESSDVPEPQIAAAIDYMSELWARVNRGVSIPEFADLHARADGAPWGDRVPRMRMAFEVEWWRRNEVDAGATLEALSVPTLALFGSGDAAVPPRDNAPPMEARLARAPTDDYTVTVLSDANHQFMIGDDLHPLYLRTMRRWVSDRFIP